MSASMTFNNSSLIGTPGATLALLASETFNLDLHANDSGAFQVAVTFGTIAATAGLQVSAGRRIGAGPTPDSQPVLLGVIAAVVGAQSRSFSLPTGRYQVTLTNLDATNGLTGIAAALDTVDGQ